jgi:hypothetical protein
VKYSIFLLILAGMISGCDTTTSIQGVDGPYVTLASPLVIEATFQRILTVNQAVTPIDLMPNSAIETSPDPQHNLHLRAVISLDDVKALEATVQNVESGLPLQTLPGGRLIPNTVGGTLPGFSLPVPELGSFEFYFERHSVGLFVPVQFDAAQVIGSYPIFDDSNHHLGELSVVGQDATAQNSGFFLLLDLIELSRISASTAHLQ